MSAAEELEPDTDFDPLRAKLDLVTMRIKDVAFHGVEQFDTKKLEATRRAEGTLVVREDKAARDVAAAVEAMEAALVVVIDDDDEVTGLVVPDEILAMLRANTRIKTDSLVDAVAAWEVDPDEQKRRFRHEWLSGRPNLVWCKTHQRYEPPPGHD